MKKKNKDFILIIKKKYLPEAAAGSLVLFCAIERNKEEIFDGLSENK
jgi:hypothetical protein